MIYIFQWNLNNVPTIFMLHMLNERHWNVLCLLFSNKPLVGQQASMIFTLRLKMGDKAIVFFHSNDDIDMMKKIFATDNPEETRFHLEEEHGFELCVHSRNFIAGTAIATNITLALQRSRRTIILLTQ